MKTIRLLLRPTLISLIALNMTGACVLATSASAQEPSLEFAGERRPSPPAKSLTPIETFRVAQGDACKGIQKAVHSGVTGKLLESGRADLSTLCDLNSSPDDVYGSAERLLNGAYSLPTDASSAALIDDLTDQLVQMRRYDMYENNLAIQELNREPIQTVIDPLNANQNPAIVSSNEKEGSISSSGASSGNSEAPASKTTRAD